MLATDVGCASPDWYEPRTVTELEEVARSLDFGSRDWMIRAEAWSTGATSPNGQLTMPAGSTADSMIDRALGLHERTGTLPTISEVIPGPTTSCLGVALVIGPAGETLVEYSLRRLEVYPYVAVGSDAPNHPGGVVLAETHHDPEAIGIARHMAAKVGYTGAATFEFRRRPDGELVFLKVDPRICNTLALSTRIGQDEASALYDGFRGRATGPPPAYRDGVRWIWAGAHVYGARRRRVRMSYTRQAVFLARQLPRLRAAGDLSWIDPMPALNSFWRGLRPRSRRTAF
jgi:predicted ATP-grasp superfamily ATP-dependent carboligase